MKKQPHKLTKFALALLCCMPLVMVGCATQPAAVQAQGAEPVQPQTPERAPMPVVEPAKLVAKQGAAVVEAKKAESDAPKIIPGSGVFVRPASVAAAPAGPQDIVLNFEGADLREVVRVVMGDMLGENYTIDPKVNGTVTIHTSQAINRAAVTPILETVLRMNGAAMVKENGSYKIGPLNSALRGSTTPKMGALQPGYSVQIVQLQYIAAREMSKILEPLLPEGSILRVDENRNLLMLAGAEGEMRNALETVNVFDLDWLAGMSVGLFTLKSADVKSILPELEILFGDKSKTPFAGLLRILPIERMNAVFVVSPRPQYLEQARVWIDRLDRSGGRSGTRLHVYPVQNGSAEKIAALLGQVIGAKSGNGSGTPAPSVAPGLVAASLQSSAGTAGAATGAPTVGAATAGGTLGASAPTTTAASVVASGTGEALGLSAASEVKVIADRDNNALLILANGAEYEKIEEALEWYFNNGSNNLTGKLFNTDKSVSALPTDPNATTVTPFLPFSAVWRATGGNVSAVLSALASKTDVNILSSPHIMVTDNQVAKINVGQSVPIEGQSTVVGTNIVRSVSYVDTGVVLSVRPHINAGGLVTLEVSQEVSDVQAGVTTSGLNSPTINKRSAQTMVAVQSGDTMVLAGLIKDDKTAGSAGIPLLSEIPVVGALFGAKAGTNNRRELIITITPRVVNDNQQARDVTAEFRKKLTGMNKLNAERAPVSSADDSVSTQVQGAKGN